MSTEVPLTPKHDIQPIDAQEARARATANTDSEYQDLKERRSINPRKAALALALGTGAVVGGGMLAMEAFPGNTQATNEQEGQGTDTKDILPTDSATSSESPTSIASSSPSPSSTAALENQPITGGDTLGTLELEAGQTDEMLVNDFIHGLAGWTNEGSDTATEYQLQHGKGKSVDEVAAEIAQNNRQKFIDTYISSTALTNERVAHFIDDMTRGNANTVMYATITDPQENPQNLDYYKRAYELSSPVAKAHQQGETRTLQFTVKGSSNYEDTTYFNKQTDADDIAYTAYTVAFTPENGKEKITDIATAYVKQ
jgi:hypothetical protein